MYVLKPGCIAGSQMPATYLNCTLENCTLLKCDFAGV